MRVVILATAIGPTNAGAGQYARQLLPRLLPLLAADGCQVSVLLSKGGAFPVPEGSGTVVRLPQFLNRKVSRVLLEHIYPSFFTWKCDVFLSLDSRLPFGPVWAKQKLVVMHDIQVLHHLADPNRFPMDSTRAALTYTCMGMKKAIRKADVVITDSQFMAEELQSFASLPRSRIIPIPCGIDHEWFQPLENGIRLEQLRKLYKLPWHFYLFVGQPSRQKNLGLVVRAYASGELNPEYRLPVVVAWDMRRSDLFQSTLALIEQTGLKDVFRFIGYVRDEDMPPMYRAARALLYPSLYEGFGLPPLEAMACGTPVLVSNRASLPELVGNAALLIDATRPESLLEALQRVNHEPTRRTLIEKGLERARAFSWERTAQLVAKTILSVRDKLGHANRS